MSPPQNNNTPIVEESSLKRIKLEFETDSSKDSQSIVLLEEGDPLAVPIAASSSSTNPTKNTTAEPIQFLLKEENSKQPPNQENEDVLISLIASWNGKKYPLTLPLSSTLKDLKRHLCETTCVPIQRQKLIGLLRGKLPSDDTILSSLSLKPDHGFLMMGSVDEAILKEKEEFEHLPDIVNDLDFDYYASAKDGYSPMDDAENQKALLKTIEKTEIHIMNEPRPGKKLLVLDLDYTLYDCKSPASHISQVQRPGLHTFLSTMYLYYDLVIWSQTSRRWLEAKLTELGMLTHPDYRLSFVLDRGSMFTITNRKRKTSEGTPSRHEVKALPFIWNRLGSFYGPKNTIHVDDLSRNFAMNPKNGLKIKAFKNAHVTRAEDRELQEVGRYLLQLVLVDDLTTLNHGKFRKFEGPLPALPAP